MRLANLAGAAALLLTGAVLLQGAASAQDEAGFKLYRFGTHAKHTNISFVSEAEIETINGTTSSMSGTAFLNLEKGEGKANLTIPVKDMKTGIPTRDEHMRNDVWLDAAKYPDITFVSDDITLADAKKKTWTAKGKITIHGVTRDLETEVKISPISEKFAEQMGGGEWIRVVTSFDVKLSDFDIKGHDPGVIGPKVSDTWTVKFQCFAQYKPDGDKK